MNQPDDLIALSTADFYREDVLEFHRIIGKFKCDAEAFHELIRCYQRHERDARELKPKTTRHKETKAYGEHGVMLADTEYARLNERFGPRLAQSAIEEYGLQIAKGGAAAKHKSHYAGILDYMKRGYICKGEYREPKIQPIPEPAPYELPTEEDLAQFHETVEKLAISKKL